MRVAMAKKQTTKSSGPKKKKARPQQSKARRSSVGGYGDKLDNRPRGAHGSVAYSGRRQSGASVMFEEEAMVSISSRESHSRLGGARPSSTSSHNGGAAIQRGWGLSADSGAIPHLQSPKIGAMSRSRMSQAESTTPSEAPSQKPWAGQGGKYKIVSLTSVVAKSWDKKVKAKGSSKGQKDGKNGLNAVIPSLFARDGTSALKRAVSYRQQQRRRSSKDDQEGSLAWFGARNVDAGQAPPGLSPDLVEKFVQYRRSEGQQHRQQSSGLFIRVDSKIRTFVDILSLTAVMYCTFMVPFDMVFTPEQTRSSMITDIIVEVFFLLEICVNFFTSYYDSDNNHITSNKLIALHYLKGWFVIDAAGSVPTEMAAQITLAQLDGQLEDVDGNLGTISNLKTIRVIRLFKLVRLLRVEALLGHLEFSLPLLSAVVGLLRLLLMISILSHLTACVWYYMATRNIYNSWVSKYHLGCCSPNQVEAPIDHGCETVEALPSISALYSEAMYWSITTISAVGYGDVLPCNPEEENMAVVAMVLGSALFAYVVGAISSVVSSSSSQDKKQHEKMMCLREYLNLRNIPADLARIIRVQCMHKWKHSVFSEEDILDEFMPQTRREVVEHILGEVVSQVAMFKYVDNSDFLTEVTLKFRPVATGNLDTPIQSIGDKGPDIFVVLRGHVNLLDEQGEVVGVAGKGTAIFENELISSLGEDEGLDCPWKYCAPYSIIPSANGEVFTLRRPDFINILRRYPKVRELYCQFKDDPLWQVEVDHDLFLNDNDTSFEGTPSSVNNEDLQASYAASRMSVPPMIETSRVVGEGGGKVKVLLRSLKTQIDKRELLMKELKHLEKGGSMDDGGGFVMMHRTRNLPPLRIDGYPPMRPDRTDRTASFHESDEAADTSGRQMPPRWKNKLTDRLIGDSSEFEADSGTPRTDEGSHCQPASTRTSQSHSHDRRSSVLTSTSMDAREQRLSNGTQDSQHGLESAPHQSSNVHGPMFMLKRSSLLGDGGKQRNSPVALEQSNTPPTSVVSPSAVVSLLMPLNSP